MNELIACPHCDLLTRRTPLPPGRKALCPRCGALLYRCRRRGIETALALSCSGLILLLIANLAPLLALQKGGMSQEVILWSGVALFVGRGEWLLALLIFVTLILLPLLRLGALLYVLFPLYYRQQLPYAAPIYRLNYAASPWSMLEIFLLGGLVSVVKLGEMAVIIPGIAAYAFVALILITAWADYALEPHDVWMRLRREVAG